MPVAVTAGVALFTVPETVTFCAAAPVLVKARVVPRLVDGAVSAARRMLNVPLADPPLCVNVAVAP